MSNRVVITSYGSSLLEELRKDETRRRNLKKRLRDKNHDGSNQHTKYQPRRSMWEKLPKRVVTDLTSLLDNEIVDEEVEFD